MGMVAVSETEYDIFLVELRCYCKLGISDCTPDEESHVVTSGMQSGVIAATRTKVVSNRKRKYYINKSLLK